MDWDSEPTLKEFATTFNEYVDEIGVLLGDNPAGWISSHKIVGRIRVRLEDDNDDTDYDIVGLDVDQLFGCGCMSGVVIKIKKVS